MLGGLLDTVNTILEENFRADALIALADKLPANLLPKALNIATAIKSNYDRHRCLNALASPLTKMSDAQLMELWTETLYKLSSHIRENLLRDIKELVPVIFKLGGELAVVEISHTIQDVVRWWP